ncbi:hypothetical protein CDIK_4094 [Cucumispora dikerogammari]|nr:hypothetical protein CDIK_4094 [Cucumispora dikerogammari]
MNTLITGEFYYSGCGKINKINRNDWLDDVALSQLIESADYEKTVESIQDEFKTDVEEDSENYSNVCSKIILFSYYIPSCRLLNKPEGLGNEIKERLLAGDFNIFGMALLLEKDKDFHVSLIFAKK